MPDTARKVPFSATEPYRFCPADGTRLEEPRPSGGVRCPLCGRSWYRSSAPAVGATIVRDGKALVTIRAGEPEKGRIDLPGGFLEVGEHPVDGLVREVREELGVGDRGVEPADLAGDPYLRAGRGVHAGDRVQASIVGGEPNPADDVAKIRWVALEELDAADFAWEHDREMVRGALGDA